MTVSQVHSELVAIAEKSGRHFPTKTTIDGKYYYVTVLEPRGNGLVVMDISEEYDDTAGVINDLGRYWETFDAICMVEVNGKLHPIQAILMDTQNFNNVLGWEKSVFFDLQ